MRELEEELLEPGPRPDDLEHRDPLRGERRQRAGDLVVVQVCQHERVPVDLRLSGGVAAQSRARAFRDGRSKSNPASGLEKTLHGVEGEHLAAVEDRDAVAGLFHLGEKVARQEDREAAVVREALQKFPDLPYPGGIEPVGRLVEDEHARVSEERLGDAEPLPHAERIGADAVVEALLQRDEACKLRDAVRRAAVDHAREDLQILPSGQLAVEIGSLDNRADVPHGFLEIAGDAEASDRHGAGIGAQQARQHAHGRGLSGSVRAEEAEYLSRLELERNAGDDFAPAEAFGEILGREHRHPVILPAAMKSFWRTVPLVLSVPLAALLCWGFVEALAPPRGAPVRSPAPAAAPTRHAGQFLAVALGDSLTRGTGAPAGSGYVDDVADSLRREKPGFRLENLAIEGLETGGLRDLLSHPEPRSLVGSADAVFLSIGGNDLSHAAGRGAGSSPLEALGAARRNFESNLEEILGVLRASNPSAPIVLLLLYNPFGGSELGAAGSALIVDWNAAAEKIALSHGVRTVPTFDVFENHPDRLSRDRFHPNEKGYRLIANRVHEAL